VNEGEQADVEVQACLAVDDAIETMNAADPVTSEVSGIH
jgi:hypothetical protein